MFRESEDSVNRAFNEKMDAALFFFGRLSEILVPNMPLATEIPDELFYYADAVVFEFYAASQQLLQLVNLKAKLNLLTHEVGRSNFRKKLQRKRPDLLRWWDDAMATAEMHVLEAYRQHITHRGGSILVFATEGEKGLVIAITIPIRWRFKNGEAYQVRGGKSVDLLEELKQMASKLNQLHNELQML